jgi:hypothetical protein
MRAIRKSSRLGQAVASAIERRDSEYGCDRERGASNQPPEAGEDGRSNNRVSARELPDQFQLMHFTLAGSERGFKHCSGEMMRNTGFAAEEFSGDWFTMLP